MRSFQLNKESLKKIHLPIRSLEINLGDKISKERDIELNIKYIIEFMNKAVIYDRGRSSVNKDGGRNFINKLNPLKTTLLFAHGRKHKRFKWRLVDNKRAKSILKWVRERDGKFDLIILIVCNPEKCKIKTQKSLLIMPNKVLELSFQRFDNKWVWVKLIKPNN